MEEEIQKNARLILLIKDIYVFEREAVGFPFFEAFFIYYNIILKSKNTLEDVLRGAGRKIQR